MTVLYNLSERDEVFKNPVITIGSFDGVHRGHRAIFDRMLEIAQSLHGEPVVFTFSEHPRKLLTPHTPPKILTTAAEKIHAIEQVGINNIVMMPFTHEIAALTAEEFLFKIVFYHIGKAHIVVGYDHAFGKGRQGDFEFLKGLSLREGFLVERVEPVCIQSRPVSSSWIRTEIEDGNIALANMLLGRPYTLRGTVVKGQMRGRLLGYPTANITPDDPDKIIPKDGVYAVRVHINGMLYHGMLNIGTNPTFENTERTIEVHIFDFDADIYGQTLEVFFIERIRDEKRFGSVTELKEQLHNDKLASEKILAGN
ncbi:MAG TPA: bifunctional riboflavin kinase/FAD synthetase [Spirochaetota bacterium]|nr:bifunctional riboflavin kinase/FAD synthetase [Spirochaetota bacterium]HPP50216.1 bifunctional riboflavin kinase/FAD synthetase [Spirochaetota bacterium]